MMEFYKPLDKTNSFQSKNFVGASAKSLDLHSLSASKRSKSISMRGDLLGLGKNDGVNIDANIWLPQAAEHYNISPDIRDYVLAPIPATICGIPNTNGDCFSTKQMLQFQPNHGMLSYKTFKGKPTHVEHINKDYTIAKGVIFDSFLHKLQGFRDGHARLTLLLGFDRTRDPELAEKIATNKLNTYSIGVFYNQYRCSLCGNLTQQGTMHVCDHTKIGRATYRDPRTNKLVYRDCENLVGFECSAVANPAFVSAHHNPNQVMDVSKFIR